MNTIVNILSLLGSLGLFLYGMKTMSEGLEKFAGERLRNILAAMTKNRFMGVVTGIAVTALIQSSSATTVMVVGFVNSGMMKVAQAIGIIMGANIGTSITGENSDGYLYIFLIAHSLKRLNRHYYKC